MDNVESVRANNLSIVVRLREKSLEADKIVVMSDIDCLLYHLKLQPWNKETGECNYGIKVMVYQPSELDRKREDLAYHTRKVDEIRQKIKQLEKQTAEMGADSK